MQLECKSLAANSHLVKSRTIHLYPYGLFIQRAIKCTDMFNFLVPACLLAISYFFKNCIWQITANWIKPTILTKTKSINCLSLSFIARFYYFFCLIVGAFPLPMTVCLYLFAHRCICLRRKGNHPRLSGLDLHGDLTLNNPRTVAFQLRLTVFHQTVITNHLIALLLL